MILHVNADYPDALAVDVSPAALPYKTTDHDLPLLILQLEALPTPEPGATAVPSLTPTVIAPIAPAAGVFGGWIWWVVVGLAAVGGGTAVWWLRQRP